jgi:hypothetical protein
MQPPASQRLRTIRRRVTAGALATFVAAWLAVAALGKGGATTTSTPAASGPATNSQSDDGGTGSTQGGSGSTQGGSASTQGGSGSSQSDDESSDGGSSESGSSASASRSSQRSQPAPVTTSQS